MKTIFFFEDEKGQSHYFKQALEKEGYIVSVHQQAEVANVADIIAQKFDLFLLDIRGQLEEEEGLTFAQQLRDKGCSTPIIFSSVRGLLPEISKKVSAIDAPLFTRPHSMQSLVNEIKDVLGD